MSSTQLAGYAPNNAHPSVSSHCLSVNPGGINNRSRDLINIEGPERPPISMDASPHIHNSISRTLQYYDSDDMRILCCGMDINDNIYTCHTYVITPHLRISYIGVRDSIQRTDISSLKSPPNPKVSTHHPCKSFVAHLPQDLQMLTCKAMLDNLNCLGINHHLSQIYDVYQMM